MKIKAFLILSTSLILCSCSPALVNLPNCPAQEVQQCEPVVSYPSIDMPPIPRVIHCTIEPGIEYADKGCSDLIRNYAAVQKKINQWQEQQL